MAYVQGGDGGERASRCRGRRSGRGYQGPDLISSLPDDLLHHILSFVTTPEAVRTSALSRRWTGVWTRVPRLLLLDEESKDVDRMLDSFDGVLRRYATDVDIADLTISYHWDCPEVTEERATSWAGFAARRVTGRFDLSVKVQSAGTDEHFLELPWFERTAEISLDMSGMRVQLPPAAAAGNFTRLTKLQMSHLLFMDGGGGEGISDVVSRRCPRLETLELEHIDDVEALSLSSESLLCLRLVSLFPLRRLDLEAANLRRMQLEDCFAGHGGWNGGTVMRLSTPVLEEVVWEDEYPDVVEVVRLPTCLKQLAVREVPPRRWHWQSDFTKVLELFSRADVLRIISCIPPPPQYSEEQWNLIHQMQLPYYSELDLVVTTNGHRSYGSNIIHFLKRNSSIRNLTLALWTYDKFFQYRARNNPAAVRCMPEHCTCHERSKWWDQETISLDSLEQLVIRDISGELEERQLTYFIVRNSKALKKLVVVFWRRVTGSRRRFLRNLRKLSASGCTIEFNFPRVRKRTYRDRRMGKIVIKV